MIKAVAFDLDHTLFDRYATLKKVVPEFRKNFKINKNISDDFIFERISWADRQFVHKGWQDIFNHLCQSNIFEEAPDYKAYVEFLLNQFKNTAVPYDFSIPTLVKLREMGLKIGIITNGRHDIQDSKLNILNLKPYVDYIIIGGDYPYQKPDERIFHLMAEKLGVKIREMMFVGDHPKFDVDGSRNAGAVPLWVETTGTWIFPEIEKPYLRAKNVSFVPKIIEELNKN